MLNGLIELFNNNPEFTRLKEVEREERIAVFSSPEQLYCVVCYENEETLLQKWEESSMRIALDIQSKLTGAFSDLRWDIYMLLVVQDGLVTTSTRKTIENDRNYFRKIILSKDDIPFENRLPLFFEIKDQEGIFFNDLDFLATLKQFIKSETIEKLGEKFFNHNLSQVQKVLGVPINKINKERSGDNEN